MAASKEPSEDAIITFIGVTSLQRGDAIKWLQIYNNDANSAVNAYFENPSAIFDQQSQVRSDEQRGQVSWDEDQFHLDKTEDGPDGQNHLGIRPADTLRPGVFDDSAPTRPPSRVSTRATTAADGANQIVTMESEDEQMKQAMALSLENRPDHQVGFSERETFGPANRAHYETAKWAMTVAGPQAEEIHLNPEPVDRKRPEGSPAFLKPSAAGHRLPALLKILHAIPMAREALLNRSYMLPDYGHDNDWWDGTAIRHLRIVNLDLEGKQVTDDDIVYETQRLMAFLDDTKRAYGSADVLANMNKMSRYNNDKMEDFLNEWHHATARSASNAPLVNIFNTEGTKTSREESETTTVSQPIVKQFVDEQVSGKGGTLYDVLDYNLWADNKEDEETFLEKVGEVLSFEIHNQVASVAGLGVEIPPTWYADRYLRSSTKQVKDMLSRKRKVEADLDCQEKAQAAITKCSRPRDGEAVNAAHLLLKATAYFEQTSAYRDTIQQRSGPVDSYQGPDESSSGPKSVAAELKTLAERISQKLKAFEEVQENAREKIKEISQMYTKASGDPMEPPHHRYTLRGVSTTSSTVYVLEKTKPEHKDDMLSTEAKDWQWWKITFMSNEAKPVVRMKVTEADVLKAASVESSSALLVYATERATSYEPEELPPQLRNFVRADNLYFSTELEESSSPKPTTPTKRKVHDEDSDDLETHYHRSPPNDRPLVDTAESNNDVDFNPASYCSNPSPPALSHQRTNSYNAATIGSFDDVIPTSLQDTGRRVNSSSRLLNMDGASEGQEMQERGAGKSLLHRQKGSNDEDTLGSFVPEINMVDDEEDEDQRGVKGG